MNRKLFCILFILFVFAVQVNAAEKVRKWTGSNGKVIEAEFLSFENDIVKLKLANGKESNVLLSKFSGKDQEYILSIGKTDDPFADGEKAKEEDTPKGIEILKRTDFKNKYVPDGKPWIWMAANSLAEVQNKRDALSIKVTKHSGDYTQIFTPINLKEDRKYILTFEVRADKETELKWVVTTEPKQPKQQFRTDKTVDIKTEWTKTDYEFEVRLPVTKDPAKLAFRNFETGVTYEFRYASLLEIDPAEETDKDNGVK